MAQELLESGALSAFCGSIATMINAGIQTDEAVLMLGENRERSHFQEVCATVYDHVVAGSTLSEAMRASGGFPTYAVGMVETGEKSGHLEQVLRNLEMYYDEEARLFAKLRQSVRYPAALLFIMTVILAFSLYFILPIFGDVYESMASSLVAGSLMSVRASRIIGTIALAIVAICTVVAIWLAASSTSERGRQRVVRLLEVLPFTKNAMYQLALSRFTASLAAYVSSGITSEEALLRASKTVDHEELHRRLERAQEAMISLDDPRSLAQAIGECEVFEPLYARMLNVGIRSGSSDKALAQFSEAFFDDAVSQIDHALDLVEPIFAAFLTLSVGITLVAVMLPLIGLMRAIG